MAVMTAPLDLHRAFLDDIVASPADDGLRLIYADWLEEEAGEPQRAEFIRAQIAGDESRALALFPCVALRSLSRCPWTSCWPVAWSKYCRKPPPEAGRTTSVLEFRRGFPAALLMQVRHFVGWERIGDMFRRYPIEEVRLVNRRPLAIEPDPGGAGAGAGAGGVPPGGIRGESPRKAPQNPPGSGVHPPSLFRWIRSRVVFGVKNMAGAATQPYELPAPLFELLASDEGTPLERLAARSYETEEDALADLSQACLELGRAAARDGEARGIDPYRKGE